MLHGIRAKRRKGVTLLKVLIIKRELGDLDIRAVERMASALRELSIPLPGAIWNVTEKASNDGGRTKI